MTAPERRRLWAPPRAVALVVAAAIFAVAPRALADDEIDPSSLRAEKLADDAFASASRGAYAEALQLYLKANDVAPSAAIAFDVAWIYDEHLGAPSLALEWYRRVLAAPDVAPELASRAQGRVRALEAASRAGSGSVATTTSPHDEHGNATGAPPSSWSKLRTWALVAGGASVVAFGAGAAFAVVAKNKDSEAATFCNGDRCTDARAITLTKDATSAASVANVAIVTGAVFLATGVTLWLLAPRRGGVDVSVRSSTGISSGAAWLSPSLVLGGSLP